MSADIARLHEVVPVPPAEDLAHDPVTGELHERLRSLDSHCPRALREGLEAVRDDGR